MLALAQDRRAAYVQDHFYTHEHPLQQEYTCWLLHKTIEKPLLRTTSKHMNSTWGPEQGPLAAHVFNIIFE